MTVQLDPHVQMLQRGIRLEHIVEIDPYLFRYLNPEVEVCRAHDLLCIRLVPQESRKVRKPTCITLAVSTLQGRDMNLTEGKGAREEGNAKFPSKDDLSGSSLDSQPHISSEK